MHDTDITDPDTCTITDAATDAIIDGVDRLPSLGAVYQELESALRDDSHTAGQLSSIVAHDVGLTAEVFRVVNSASFGLGTRIESLPQAVGFLGSNSLRNLVAANSLMQPDDRTDAARIERLNEHSLATGALAAFIRRDHGGDGHESAEAFTAGLLHEVGALVLARCTPRTGATAWSVLEQDDIVHERAEFDSDRFAVGARLLRRWAFDGALVGAIGRLASTEPIPRDGLDGALRLAHTALCDGLVDAADVLAGDHDAIRPVVEHLADVAAAP